MSADLANGLSSGFLLQLSKLQRQSESLSSSQRACLSRMSRKRRLRSLVTDSLSHQSSLHRLLLLSSCNPTTTSSHLSSHIGTLKELLEERHREREKLRKDNQTEIDKQMKKKRRKGGEQVTGQDAKLLENEELEDGGEEGILESERWKRRKLADCILGYRLAGVSLFRTHAPRVEDRWLGIRFDSSYHGKFFERFYAILGPKPNDSEEGNEAQEEVLELKRHTLPHFIPAEELFERCTVPGFVREVSEYLDSFVSRRENVKCAVRELGRVRGKVSFEPSVAFDTVEIVVGQRAKKATIKLTFKSLLECVPHTVVVKCKYGEESFALEEGKLVGIDFALDEFLLECLDNLIPNN